MRFRYCISDSLKEEEKKLLENLIEHIVIIRFSVDLNRNEFKAKLKSLLDEKRLSYRFDLFKKFCFPSLRGQTYKDFKVIVLIDNDLPLKWKETLENIVTQESNFIIHTWKKEDTFEKNDWFDCYIDKTKPFLCTTRIDDDDMIHSNANVLFKKALLENKMWKKFKCNYNLSTGIYVHIENDNSIYPIKCTNKELAVFMSMITPMDFNKNVYSYCHDTLSEYSDLKKYYVLCSDANLFAVSNHDWGNDNRKQRFAKHKKDSISLEEIYTDFLIN